MKPINLISLIIVIVVIAGLVILASKTSGEPRQKYCEEQGYYSFKWKDVWFSNYDFYCVPGEYLVTEQEFKEWEERR